jgi:hypothetical protein
LFCSFLLDLMPNRVSRFHVSVSQNNEILIQITRKEYRYRFFHSRYYSIVGETVIQIWFLGLGLVRVLLGLGLVSITYCHSYKK